MSPYLFSIAVTNFQSWTEVYTALERGKIEATDWGTLGMNDELGYGATAPYARAELALFEAGKQQPRTLANAFLTAQHAQAGIDPMQQAVDSLGAHLQALDQMYGSIAEQRVVATTKDLGALGAVAAPPCSGADYAILETGFTG